VSSTATGSLIVPKAGEDYWLGEEDREKDESLEEEGLPIFYGVETEEGEDGELPESPRTVHNRLVTPLFQQRREEITNIGTVRNKRQEFVIGTAFPKMSMEMTAESAGWYYGLVNKYVGACGWMLEGRFAEKPQHIVAHACTASKGIPATEFASLVDCDICNEGDWTEFEPTRNGKGEAVNTPIPIFGNVRPYAKEEPHNLIGHMNTVEDEKIRGLKWRYITKGRKYALVFVGNSSGDDWVFIEAKYLPGTSTLCRGRTPKAPEDTKHDNWPHVCAEGPLP
jgi:hypothetical protein